MKKIFVTTLYRNVAKDWWGFALSQDGELLVEENAQDPTWIKLQLGLDGSESNHDIYKEKYPEGYELVFVHQFEFDEAKEFKEARLRSLCIYANASA